jgi:hypothetical protein
MRIPKDLKYILGDFVKGKLDYKYLFLNKKGKNKAI